MTYIEFCDKGNALLTSCVLGEITHDDYVKNYAVLKEQYLNSAECTTKPI